MPDQTFSKEIKDPYKKISKVYDKFIEPPTVVLRKIMLKMFPPKEGMRVLEIGCGTGTNLKLYQKAGCEVYGIDLSPSMLKVASNKLGEQARMATQNPPVVATSKSPT